MNAFGVVSIVTSVLGIITPTMGILLSGVSGIFALFALKAKDSLAQGSLILNILNLTILSPVTVMSLFSKPVLFQTNELKVIYWLILILQGIGILLWWYYSKEQVKEVQKDREKKRAEPYL
ncbi:hypothetical protein ACE1GQ_001665 [Vibrio fluvialis]